MARHRTGYTGFEPMNVAVKVLCLTAWRIPYTFPRQTPTIKPVPTIQEEK